MSDAMRWLKSAAEQADGAFISLEKRGVLLEMGHGCDNFCARKLITWAELLSANTDPIAPMVKRMREELRATLGSA